VGSASRISDLEYSFLMFKSLLCDEDVVNRKPKPESIKLYEPLHSPDYRTDRPFPRTLIAENKRKQKIPSQPPHTQHPTYQIAKLIA
jgi:hypothetical protein